MLAPRTTRRPNACARCVSTKRELWHRARTVDLLALDELGTEGTPRQSRGYCSIGGRVEQSRCVQATSRRRSSTQGISRLCGRRASRGQIARTDRARGQGRGVAAWVVTTAQGCEKGQRAVRSSAHQRKRICARGRSRRTRKESLKKPRNAAAGKLWRRYAGMRAGRYVAPQGPDFAGILTSRVSSIAVHCEVEVKACTDRFDFGRLRVGARRSADHARARRRELRAEACSASRYRPRRGTCYRGASCSGR